MTLPYFTSNSTLRRFGTSLASLATVALLLACAPGSRAGARGSDAAALTAEESADALRLSQETRLELQTQSSRLKELEGQVRDLTEILSWTSEQIQAQNRALDSLGRGGRPAGSDVGAAPAASTLAPQRISSDEASQYRLALDQYFGRNYAAAIKAFTDLQAKYPKGAYADNAEYWIGESRFAQGDFTGALAAFRKVSTYAGTEKGDDAQLKIATCYLRLNDRKRAEDEFRKLVSLYPSSEYVDRAQTEIAKLGETGTPGEKSKPE
jgi:tol-pal system protein YbgF